MKGPIPKPSALRQRKNKVVTAAVLPSLEASKGNAVPPLPQRESPAEIWHPKVVEWWRSFWTSPMAAEVQESDKLGGLTLAAESLHRAWTAREDSLFLRYLEAFHKLLTEFGGSPIARRRLQWEIEKAESAEERTTARRQKRKLVEVSKQDPRDILKKVV
jgi:hypothetical protein